MTCVHPLPFQGGESLRDHVMDSKSKTNDTTHADDNNARTASADPAATANLTTSTVRPWVEAVVFACIEDVYIAGDMLCKASARYISIPVFHAQELQDQLPGDEMPDKKKTEVCRFFQ